jgi:hypothetical protein
MISIISIFVGYLDVFPFFVKSMKDQTGGLILEKNIEGLNYILGPYFFF